MIHETARLYTTHTVMLSLLDGDSKFLSYEGSKRRPTRLHQFVFIR